MTTFADFDLDPLVLKALESMDYKEPSSIQEQAIPLIQEGRDLIALAQTGSGKTAACAIPICSRVDVSRPDIQALIIVPTRELALQYATEAQRIGRDRRVKAFAMAGGEDSSLQESKLKDGVQVLVATPGRLIDFVYTRRVNLSQVNTLILDEADEMLSMGFYDDIEFIIQCLVHQHQTLLFSATMPKQIRLIAEKHMNDPTEVVLTRDQRAPSQVAHHFAFCSESERTSTLKQFVKKHNPKQAIIFCRSRVQVEKVCRDLRQAFGATDYLHAGLNQSARRVVTRKFRSSQIQLLVATDVAARGLDFNNVTHVIIYQLSEDPDIYIHRSGRTGRFEKEGFVMSIITSRELRLLERVLTHIQREPIWEGDPPKNFTLKASNRSGAHPARSSRPRRPRS